MGQIEQLQRDISCARGMMGRLRLPQLLCLLLSPFIPPPRGQIKMEKDSPGSTKHAQVRGEPREGQTHYPFALSSGWLLWGASFPHGAWDPRTGRRKGSLVSSTALC